MLSEFPAAEEKLSVMNHFMIAKIAFKINYIMWMRYKGGLVFFGIVNIMIPLLPIFMGKYFGGVNFVSNFEASGGGKHPEAFIILGANLWVFIMFALFEFATFIRDEQQQGTLESLFLTPANQILIVIGRGAATALMATITFIFSLIVGLFLLDPRLLFSQDIISFSAVVIIAYLGFVPMVGISLVIGALVVRFKEVYNVISLFLFVMGSLMGIFFPILLLPVFIQVLSIFFPGTWLVHDLRYLITGIPPLMTYLGLDQIFPIHSIIADLLLLSLLTIVWGFIGWLLFNKTLNSLKKSEGIGIY